MSEQNVCYFHIRSTLKCFCLLTMSLMWRFGNRYVSEINKIYIRISLKCMQIIWQRTTFTNYFTPVFKSAYSLFLEIIIYIHLHYICEFLKYFVCLIPNFETMITLKVLSTLFHGVFKNHKSNLKWELSFCGTLNLDTFYAFLIWTFWKLLNSEQTFLKAFCS